MNYLHTVGGIIGHIMHYNPGWNKLLNIIQAPSLSRIMGYLNGRDDILRGFKDEDFSSNADVDFKFTEVMYTRKFDTNEYKKLVRGHGMSHKHGPFYFEPFSIYIRRDYRVLHALPIFCVSSIDVLEPVIEALPRKYNLKFTREFQHNEVFYRVETVDVEEANRVVVYIFTADYNIQHYVRNSPSKQTPPLFQAYMLTRDENIERLQEIFEPLLLSIDRLDGMELFKTNFMPYEPIKFSHLQSTFISSEPFMDQPGSPMKSILRVIKTCGYQSILFGQCTNADLGLEEFDNLLRLRRLPSCAVWRKLKNFYAEESKDLDESRHPNKMLLIFTIKQGTILARYSITFEKPPEDIQILETFLPSVVVPIENKYETTSVYRIYQRVYFISSMNVTFLSGSPLWFEGGGVGYERFTTTIQMALSQTVVIKTLKEMFGINTVGEPINLFNKAGVSLVKLFVTHSPTVKTVYKMYIFTSKNNAEFSLLDFLNEYILSVDLTRVSNSTLVDDSLNLIKLLRQEP